jgi:hypothetical protein
MINVEPFRSAFLLTIEDLVPVLREIPNSLIQPPLVLASCAPPCYRQYGLRRKNRHFGSTAPMPVRAFVHSTKVVKS